MNHSEFCIGSEFKTGAGTWLCTDIGSRVIIAIRIDAAQDASWYQGPPYIVNEVVFDEYDIDGCYLPALDEDIDEL